MTTSVIWLAGPIAGTFVQPYAGICSDRCHLRWGRRRPFIAGGGLGVILSLLVMAWAPSLSILNTNVANGDLGATLFESHPTRLGITLTVLSVFSLQAAIQPTQIGLRALIVDMCSAHQQNAASAWAARMIGVGNVLGQMAGSSDLTGLLPSTMSIDQFQIMCTITSIALLATLSATCLLVKEEVPRAAISKKRSGTRQRHTIGQEILVTVQCLPSSIVNVWQVQFFAWMGWFPFLYYCAT